MNEIINEIHKNINKSNNNRNFQKEMDRLIEKNQGNYSYIVSSQLLCSLQQLCAGIFVSIF